MLKKTGVCGQNCGNSRNSGMIDINDVQNNMEAMKRKELLEKHPYKIWKG